MTYNVKNTISSITLWLQDKFIKIEAEMHKEYTVKTEGKHVRSCPEQQCIA